MLNCDEMLSPDMIQIQKLKFPSRLNKVEGVALKLVPVPLGNVFGRFFMLSSFD